MFNIQTDRQFHDLDIITRIANLNHINTNTCCQVPIKTEYCAMDQNWWQVPSNTEYCTMYQNCWQFSTKPEYCTMEQNCWKVPIKTKLAGPYITLAGPPKPANHREEWKLSSKIVTFGHLSGTVKKRMCNILKQFGELEVIEFFQSWFTNL